MNEDAYLDSLYEDQNGYFDSDAPEYDDSDIWDDDYDYEDYEPSPYSGDYSED